MCIMHRVSRARPCRCGALQSSRTWSAAPKRWWRTDSTAHAPRARPKGHAMWLHETESGRAGTVVACSLKWPFATVSHAPIRPSCAGRSAGPRRRLPSAAPSFSMPPNQSFNATPNGMAPGPQGRRGHHWPRGPGAMPSGAR